MNDEELVERRPGAEIIQSSVLFYESTYESLVKYTQVSKSKVYCHVSKFISSFIPGITYTIPC